MKFDPIDVHVGQRLHQMRTSRGMTIEALGERVGVAYQQIQKYEKGANRISASVLWRIARALHLRVGWFFEGLDDAPCRLMPDADSITAARAIARMDPVVGQEMRGLIEALGRERDVVTVGEGDAPVRGPPQ